MTDRMEPTMRLRWFMPKMPDGVNPARRLQQLWVEVVDTSILYLGDRPAPKTEWRDVPVVTE